MQKRAEAATPATLNMILWILILVAILLAASVYLIPRLNCALGGKC